MGQVRAHRIPYRTPQERPPEGGQQGQHCAAGRALTSDRPGFGSRFFLTLLLGKSHHFSKLHSPDLSNEEHNARLLESL